MNIISINILAANWSQMLKVSLKFERHSWSGYSILAHEFLCFNRLKIYGVYLNKILAKITYINFLYVYDNNDYLITNLDFWSEL